MFVKKKLLVILGPTSTGKTDLALKLAQKFNGELISADSRQVYKKLDVGTGKMPSRTKGLIKEDGKWIIGKIAVHLYDVILPQNQYTVADYMKNAKEVVEEINKKRKLPIIVGGTGLYIRAIIDGLSNLSFPFDKKLRRELEKLSLIDLQKKLQHLSDQKWKMMNNSDKQNPRRLVRTIELETGKDNKRNYKNKGLIEEFDILKIGLTAPREILYQRSDKRVISRINQGMVEEAERLKREGLTLSRMRQLGLEYGVLADFLDGKIPTKEDLIRILQNKVHGYIRRQLTWFKKEKNIFWSDISKQDFPQQVEKKVGEWYH